MIYDSDAPDVQQFNADLAKREPIIRPPAGFGESFMQELGQFWRENVSVSRTIALSRSPEDRAQRVRDVAGDDAFIKALTLPGDPKTHSMIQGLADEHPGVVKTDAELLADIKQRNADLRAEHDAALVHQTGMGKVGGFLGTMVGASTDPVNIALMAAGVPEARGLSWAMSTVREMAYQAGLATAAETAIQLPVHRYKRELDSPYGLGDAITNIAGAGIGTAALTGVVKAGVRIFRGIHGARPIEGYDDLVSAASKIENPTSEQKAALEILQNQADSLRQSPFEGGARGAQTREAVKDLVRAHYYHSDVGLSPSDVVEFSGLVERGILTENEGKKLVDFLTNVRTSEDSYTIPTFDKATSRQYASEVDAIANRAANLFDGAHPQLDDAHLSALAKAHDDLANGRQVDVSQFIEQPRIKNPPRVIDDALELDAVARRQQVEQILAQQDISLKVETGAVDPVTGERVTVQRSARELLREIDQDTKAAGILQKCLVGGAE
jgi:hypothetical protein